jgi:hypothetical protein
MLIPSLILELLFAHPVLPRQDWVSRDATYRVFLTQLQSAVRRGDGKTVADLSAIPLRVNLGDGKFAMYRSRRHIERDYYYIFSPQVRRAILRQRPEELWGRDQGVTLNFGEIWFDHYCLDRICDRLGPVRIRAVNRLSKN